MSWLHYLVEGNIYLSIFYLFYCLFLQRETHYTLNRVYLLFSCAIAFAIPLIQLGWLKKPEIVDQSITAVTTNDKGFSLTALIMLGYLIGVVVSLVVLSIKLFKLQHISTTNPSFKKDNYKLVLIDDSTTAFSFFNYLFISADTLQPELVTRHELVHIQQKHSIDIMLLELFKIVNWFNPVVYLLQNSLKTLHEYIADEQTAEADLLTYATFLVNNAYGISGIAITHSFFNYNLLKKRIIMLNQQRSGKLARLKYLTVLPICAIMLCVSTLAFSKTYGYTAFASVNNTDTVKTKNVKKANIQTVKITDIKLSDPEVKNTKTTNRKKHVNIIDVKLLPPPPPPAAPVSKQNKKSLPPPPPPAPPVKKSASNHLAPPPPPAPPVNAKVAMVKFPPPMVKPDNKSRKSKAGVVKIPPPIVKPDVQ